MATIKISQLDAIHPLNSNTDNVSIVGVDTESGITGRYTTTTLADGLYANKALNVGNNSIVFPGVIGQFVGNEAGYLQINLQNKDGTGSSDFVVTANNGTDTTWFADFGLQGSQLEQGVLKPLDAYVLVQGNGSSQPGANLVVGTLTENRDIIFTQGGYETDNVVAKFVYNSGLHLTRKPLKFADGTTQNTSFVGAATAANTGIAYAQSAGSYANSAYAVANNAANVNATQNTNIQLAWNTANTALQNTSGTFAGSLNFTGNINVGSHLIVSNNSYDYSNTSLVKISGSIDAVLPPANPGYMLEVIGINGTSSRVINTSYGTGAYALFAGRKGNGTAASPTAVANNDVIARFSGSGYNGSAFTATGQGRIDIVADQDFTTANTGSRIEFYNTIPNTNTVTKIATFNSNTVSFTGSVNPMKGFVWTPRVPSDNQTAITIDYSTDSIIKANCVADVTISHSNYVSGKVVEMWLTNNDNSNHTVTHGCAALRSTNKATTFTITAGSSAYLRFFSIDGDNANTFVTVTA